MSFRSKNVPQFGFRGLHMIVVQVTCFAICGIAISVADFCSSHFTIKFFLAWLKEVINTRKIIDDVGSRRVGNPKLKIL